jgi:SulP family sulfate permease
MIAIIEAARAGVLRRADWTRNLIAGIVVAAIALPLSMAFAVASGARPEQGIYTAIIAGFAVSIFGGTRLQIAGPTGAFVAILAGVTAQSGLAGLMVATMLAGAILVAMGLTRFGRAIRFIPEPVIAGFTAGIAVIIFVGQWKDFFGLPVVNVAHFPQAVWRLISAMPRLQSATTALGLAGLALALLGPKLPGLRRIPGPILALLVVTSLQAVLELPGVRTIASVFGEIPRGLPMPALPHMSFAGVLALIPSAFTIAMLGAIESLLSAVVADGMSGTRNDPNQELIGQGIANLLAPLFGGFAATGALARTATNFRSGATGPLSGIVHCVTLLLILVLLAPLAGAIPLCALAAILFVVAWNMCDLRNCLRILRTAPRADAAILLITFVLTLLTDLVIAVNIGVLLATLQFMRRMSGSVDVRHQGAAELAAELAADNLPAVPPGTLVYSIDGPFFFAAVESLERALRQTQLQPATIVIRLGRVPFMDFTGLQTLLRAVGDLRRDGIGVYLCEANDRVRGKLERAEVIGTGDVQARYFPRLHEALTAATVKSIA